MDHRSSQYVYVPISADISKLPVEMSVELEGAPAVWKPALVGEVGRTAYRLVGPLAPGKYAVFIRITANPEVPVLNAGFLYIT